MSAWPSRMAVDPIGQWPGELTRKREKSKFKASLDSTLDLLDRESHFLEAKEARLQIAVPASQFGVRGRPFANANAEHPGIIVTLESKHGPLSYPCDTFTTWQDNLRAVALALEALRTVDRYGVTKHGQQYRGFMAIEAPANPGMSEADARRILHDAARATVFDEQLSPSVVRRAKFYTHPDTADEYALPGDYARVIEAEQYLKQKGII